ncbi:DNA cross-link repair protein SNM1 [Platanthera guangdongensis]|uniref:DNA cross-link repair protein SNM1 n=1 Tax=Platanthera guangdongensis TaxID=2320717 RepID=A0ABR2LHX1_9ASPA
MGPAKNPRASDSDCEALTLTTGADGDGDDDDFQNPSQAVAFSQSLIVSSLKSSRPHPSKLSNGCRDLKRLKPCTAVGKENASIPKKQSSGDQIRKYRGKQIQLSTNRKNLHRKINPVGLGFGNIAIGGSEGDGIEDPKSNLSQPYFESTVGKESQYMVPVGMRNLKSVVNISSNFDQDCSDACSYNVNLGQKTWSCCDLEKSMSQCGASADECKDCDESESGGACLASTELTFPEAMTKGETKIQILSHSVDQSTVEVNKGNSSEARVLELKEKSFTSEHRDYSSESNSWNELKLNRQFEDPEALENGSVGGIQFVSTQDCEPDIFTLDRRRNNGHATPIEAKLLDPSGELIAHAIGAGCDEFEPGTPLNILMDLCCEMDEQGCYGSGMASSEPINLRKELNSLEMNLLVECPLCGTNITKLSEEMRQIHTNECLDKDGTTEVSDPICQAKPNTCQQFVDTNPVLEFLRALDLCRYEEVFVKEEIDWDTLQWLTEEELISIGVVALGPRKKIVHALNEFRQRNCLAPNGESDTSNVAESERKNVTFRGNKLITEYFHGPVSHKVRGNIPVKLLHNVEKASKDPLQKRVGSRKIVYRGRGRDIPPWCCISGTPFRVDAFQYLKGDCSHWFLTHFHMDHYQGLTKNFCYGKIYCSKITGRLVNMKIGVPWDRIQILPLNEKINIAGVNLTCLDANHCPGSIIILFEPSNNKAILHTGDFRFSAEMAGSSLLQSSHIHTLILDTTYCNPQYDFPKQDEVVQFVIDAIRAESFNPKTLFLIGTYTIGKERLFLEVARILKKKVYVALGKLHLFKCLDLPEEDMQLFTANEMESHIHVVPMWTIANFKRMKHISDQYMGRYNLIVAFSPTGWAFGKGKKKAPGRRWQQGTVIRYEVPYSEHSSFTELKEFVRFISPEHIIPSVNNNGPDSVNAMLTLLFSDS